MRFFKNIFRICGREFGRIVQSRSRLYLLIVLPPIVYIFLNFIYVKGALREVPVAILDNDHTELSRTFARFVESSPNMKIVDYLQNDKQIKKGFEENRFKGCFHIPKDFTADLKRGKQSRIQSYINSRNIVYGNLLLKESTKVILTLQGGVLQNKFLAEGLSSEKAMNFIEPVQMTSSSLYNPTYNYLYYLTPGLMTVLLQMFVMFVGVRAINTEFNLDTYYDWQEKSGDNLAVMLIGKSIPYLLLNSITALLILGVMYPVFGIPLYGHFGQVYLLMLALVFTSFFMGLMLSAIFRDEIMAMDFAFVYNSPAFVFSGFTFPIWGMPFFDTIYAQLIPYTHFLYAFLKIYQMDAPFHYAYTDIWKMLLFLLGALIIMLPALLINIRKYKKQSPLINDNNL